MKSLRMGRQENIPQAVVEEKCTRMAGEPKESKLSGCQLSSGEGK